MTLTNIIEIDIIILSYIDDYQLYKISRLNNYLKQLYENKALWTLKIGKLFDDLVITEPNPKTIYFNINQYHLNHIRYDKMRNNLSVLVIYGRNNNIFSLLDWVWDYYGNWFDNVVGRFTVEHACETNNINLLEYAIDKFGSSEEDMIKRHSLGYIKANKCLDVVNYLNEPQCLKNATINGHVKILNYLEKHLKPFYISRESIDIACQRGHFETVAWYEKRGLY